MSGVLDTHSSAVVILAALADDPIEEIVAARGSPGCSSGGGGSFLVFSIPCGQHAVISRLRATDGEQDRLVLLNGGATAVMLWNRDRTKFPLLDPLNPGCFREIEGAVGEELVVKA